MNSKYELVPEFTKEHDGHTLYKIRALRTFNVKGSRVTKGDLGGWVEFEHNLNTEDNSWIFNSAIVCGFATIDQDSMVSKNAVIMGSSRVSDSQVSGRVNIKDTSMVEGSCLDGKFLIAGDSQLSNATVTGDCNIGKNVELFNIMLNNCNVDENVELETLCLEDAQVNTADDVLTLSNGQNALVTVYKKKDGILVMGYDRSELPPNELALFEQMAKLHYSVA